MCPQPDANTLQGVMHIHPEFSQALARQKQHGLAAAADRHRLVVSARRRDRDLRFPPAHRTTGLEARQDITIRAALPGDSRAITDLAILDCADPLEGEVLVAEVGGALLAAWALSDGRMVANPFRSTQAARALLGLRRKQLASAERLSTQLARLRRRRLQFRLGG
jgi:hypothetical protein